jgi:hypothetical protein
MPDEYKYDPTLYKPEDVAAGQRKINYALTVADRKLVAVLEAVTKALSGPPGEIRNHVPEIEAAIADASKLISKVATIRPPGCDSTWKPEPDPL